ncbi:unnamed protein product [Arctia plantaginis]|uniref:G-protein coupled receptors family 1 profile domain-containing protein n=1 Tax=Arctia plantaginis TaxID=874455 RepID=A0A8S1AL77_ARCPL|nr:unnamed protein product [Arctia plantaginis]
MESNYSIGSNTELETVELFRGYPDALLQFAVACCVIFILIGIPGNLITVIALGCCKKFRNATAIFIINLHVNNLIFCCMILPLTSFNYSYRHWIFGNTMCSVYSLMKYALNGTAHFTVVAITINRYIMVCHPLMYPRIYKRRSLIISVLSTWIAGFTLFLPSFLGVWGKFGLDPKGIDCTMIPDQNHVSPKIFFVCLAFAGPYLIISVCYGRIWWTVRKKMKECRNHNVRTILPITSSSGSEISGAENGDVCQEASVHKGSKDHEKLKLSSSVNLTPDGTENKMMKFFKYSFRITKKENQLTLPTRKDKKLATMILAILISFAICHLPLMLTRALYGEYKSNPAVNILAHLLEYCTSFISPIIYVIMSNEYRQAYKSLFEDFKSKVTALFKS